MSDKNRWGHLFKHYLWLASEVGLQVRQEGELWYATTRSGRTHSFPSKGALCSYIRGYCVLPQVPEEELTQQLSPDTDIQEEV